MGVDRTDYLMLGVDVGYDAFDWDKHEAEAEGTPDRRFDLVLDGMSGKYCIAGKIVAVSEPYEGFPMKNVDLPAMDIDRSALAATLAEAFGKPILSADLALLLFSHFY